MSRDLLTTAILEASEKKIQLIKKLLSPEEYDSIASDLLLLDDDLSTHSAFSSNNNFVRPQSGLSESNEIASDRLRFGTSKQQSLAEFDHKKSLFQKREAIDFFFNEHPTRSQLNNGQSDLSIELRSGHYLNFNNASKEDKILKQTQFSLLDTLDGFLSLFGIPTTLNCLIKIGSEADESMEQGEDDKFIDDFRKVNSLPYTRRKNLLTMKRRLEADNQKLERTDSLVSLIDFGAGNTSKQNPFQLTKSTEPKQYYERTLSAINPLEYQPNITKRDTSDQAKLVDCLYEKVFNVRLSGYESTERKIYKLLNKCDHEVLLLLLNDKNYQGATYFELDPMISLFESATKKDARLKRKLRHSLLIWRWINNLDNLVHLDKNELLNSNNHLNLKGTSKWNHPSKLMVADEFRAIISSTNKRQEVVGYRLIEQARVLTMAYLKKYEANLIKRIKFNHENLRSMHSRSANQAPNVQELLREPQLNVDFTRTIEIIKSLVPKRTAKRPLMPKRRSNSAKQATGRLIKDQVDLESNNGELFSESHWHSLVMSKITSGLRLVITIQQASNVPLRVVTQHQQQVSSRPSSPSFFLTSSSPNPGPFSAANHSLVSPTTYVEVVFQKQQQASSLAEGKSPSWNETLFFHIQETDVAINSDDQQQSSMLLIDEYLQLNLYDYQQRQEEHLIDKSFNSHGQFSPDVRANKILASKQRIERHLLGSLKIPLTTLLSSGKIQGSFALNQPMFLDNYQFQAEPSFMASATAADSQYSTPIKDPLRTYINLFITLDPPMPSSLMDSSDNLFSLVNESHEPEHVFRYCKLYEQLFSRSSISTASDNSDFARRQYNPRRHLKVLVLQRDCKFCLIIRLISPLQPPKTLIDGIKNVEAKMHVLARFVSLLSPLKYGLFKMRLLAPNLWFDSAQLLNRNLGGFEEKAVLLCNYFLFLGKCSAIVLANKIPEGNCVYVIVWEEQARFIIEADQENANDSSLEVKQPIEQKDFVLKLPILINSRTVALWDPVTGRSFKLNDPSHQLTSIGSIVTMENVYANMQSNSLDNFISNINFDIRLKQYWYPLFEGSLITGAQSEQTIVNANNLLVTNAAKQMRHKSFTFKNQSNFRRQLTQLEQVKKCIGRPAIGPLVRDILGRSINYDTLSQEDCNDLRTNIEKTIKASLLKWRPNRPTYFNRTLSRLISDKLPMFEELYLQGFNNQASGGDLDWKNKLAELIRSEILMVHLASAGSRQIISWPINMTYTSMKTISNLLFASGVHNADLELNNESRIDQVGGTTAIKSSTQFLVSCFVQPYQTKLMSVWLYVAAIVTSIDKKATQQNRNALSPTSTIVADWSLQ